MSDKVIIFAAKHQHSDKSLKIKFKALKELKKGSSHKDAAWTAKAYQEQ